MVRNSLRFVPWKDRKVVARDLKRIYRAASREDAEIELIAFSETWDSKYPMISQSWWKNWENITPFFSFPPEIRKVIYTTNAIESLNRGLSRGLALPSFPCNCSGPDHAVRRPRRGRPARRPRAVCTGRTLAWRLELCRPCVRGCQDSDLCAGRFRNDRPGRHDELADGRRTHRGRGPGVVIAPATGVTAGLAVAVTVGNAASQGRSRPNRRHYCCGDEARARRRGRDAIEGPYPGRLEFPLRG